MSRKSSVRLNRSTLAKIDKATARGWKPGAGPMADFLRKRKPVKFTFQKEVA